MQLYPNLTQTGEFLSLSRHYADLSHEPIAFTLANQTQVRILAPGVIQFSPEARAQEATHIDHLRKDIVLSCGVHGNETAPIEICDSFVKQILRGELVLAHRVLFIFGNLAAMGIGERFVEENMNRLFCGAHGLDQSENQAQQVNSERQRAKLLEDSLASFYSEPAQVATNRQRIHYDLHTAIRKSKNEKFAVYPFLHGKSHSKRQLMFMHACGVNTILLSGSPTTTFSYFSSREFGAHAFTVELGQVRPFGQNDMSKFAQAEASLKALISTPEFEQGEYDASLFDLYEVNQVVNKHKADFKLHFADDAPNFTDFSKGSVLASESDKSYIAEHEGEAIVFPNASVEIGQRALLTVIPTQLPTTNEEHERD